MKNNLLIFLAFHLGLAAALAQPVISNQPLSQTNCAGSAITLTVGASGTPPLLYQWRRGGTSVAVETNVALIIASLQNSNAGNYTVVVTNTEGSVTSAVAFVRVLAPPAISSQPTNFLTLSLGASLTNRVVASGSLPLGYQWRQNGSDLAGQTDSLIVLTNLTLTSPGDYTVVVTNSCGSITSRVARLDVDATYTKLTSSALVDELGTAIRGFWGDYDGDGYIDLFVTQASDNASHRNRLVTVHGFEAWSGQFA